VLVLHSFVIKLPECCTRVPEHVVVKIGYSLYFMSAFFGGYVELVCLFVESGTRVT
jgi:hypothetical protein